MKWILIFLCVPAFGQLPVLPFAPMISASSDIVVQPGGMNIAYYWNYTDLPTNQTVNTWTDRIQGVVASQSVVANKNTNSSIGIRFTVGSTTGTFYHLTNLLNLATNLNLTNVACFVAFKWDSTVNNSYTILSDTNMQAFVNTEGALYIRKAASSVLRTVTKSGGNSQITSTAVPLNLYQDAEFGGSDAINKPAFTNAVLTGLSTSCFTNVTDIGSTNVNASQSLGFSGWIAVIAIYTNSVWSSVSASNVHWFRTNPPPLGLGL